MRIPQLIFIVVSAALLPCCTGRYEGEFHEVPNQAIQDALNTTISHPAFDSCAELPPQWWLAFNDVQFNGLMESALANNPSLKKAEARIAIAQADFRKANAAFYPTIGMNVSEQHFIISRTGIVAEAIKTAPPVPGFPRFPFTYNQYDLNMDFSYQLDIWNKNKYETRAACNEIEAMRAEAFLTELIVSVSLSNAYFGLQVNMARENLANKILEIYQSEVDLTRTQVENNLESELALHKKNVDLLAAQESVAAMQQQVAISKNLVHSLLGGDFTEEICPSLLDKWHSMPFPLPTDLPLDLLTHRPDVMVKMWKAEAAAFRIKVAETNFYPNVNLLALLGFQTIHLNQWLSGDSTMGFYGPVARLPIFDGGVLKANLSTRDAEYTYAVEDYNETLLNAVKEVLNGIVSVQKNYERLQEKRKIREEKETIYRMNIELINSNLAGDFDLLDAKKEWVIAQDDEVVMQGIYIQSILDLIKALGGGYDC